MKIAYLAGPYRAKDRDGIEKNIQAARAAAIELWEMGYAVICPHLNTAHFNDDCKVDETAYLTGYLQILRKCDLLVRLPGWALSAGSVAENKLAKSKGLPAFELVQRHALEVFARSGK